MASPSPMSSHSSRLTKNPPHGRQPSSEYLPVPRRTSGQQSRSPLEAPTLSNKTPNDDDQCYVCSSPQSPTKTQKHKSLRSGISPLTWICYALHALLIILHAILLGMLLTEMDHSILISPTEANFYSVLLTVMQQTFFTAYQGALVVITQQLALRSNLLRRQTLTALHDKSLAWGGIGASILSLWRQVSVPTAVHGTLCVVLYLVSISILHVSSSSLIDVETYDNNVPTTVRTLLGLPNMTAVEAVYKNESWDNAGAVASALGQLPTMYNHGLVNSTVYDIVLDTTGTGNVTVHATTFSAKCYSAEQAYTVSANQTTIEWGDLNTTLSDMPLYEGTLWFLRTIIPGVVEGRLLSFLSFPPIPDSNGSLGTTFPVAGPIYGTAGGNFSVETEIQVTTCSLSYATQDAIIDSHTNALLSIPSPVDDPPAVWTSTTNLSSSEYDPIIDWFSLAWSSSSSTTVKASPSILCGADVDCQVSLLNMRLLGVLGLQINPNSYVTNDQSVNITSVEPSPTTLSELEEALSAMAAQVVWTAGHINITTSNATTDFIHLTGEAKVLKTVLSSRLNFNVVPVSVGLGMSVLLFVLAYILTSDVAHAEDTFTPGNVGILQLFWLFSRQPGIRESLYEVSEPSEDQLRKAGLVNVQGIDDDETVESEQKSFKYYFD